MPHRPSRLSAVALIVWSLPAAAAEPGTTQEACALQQRMERYVGEAAFEEELVTIAPDAAGYRVEIYPAPIVTKLLHGTGVSLDIAPFEFRLSRRADGDWDVEGDHGEAIRLALPASPGTGEVALVIEAATSGGSYEAVVSDRTGLTLSSSGRIASGGMLQEDAASIKESAAGEMEYSSQTQERLFGRVDASYEQRIEDVREVVTLKTVGPAGPDGGGGSDALAAVGPITTRIGAIETGGSISGLRAAAVLDLWALGVARAQASDGGGGTFRDELRGALRALGPFFDEGRTTSVASDVAIETTFGTLSVDRFEQTVELEGLVWSGSQRVALAVQGMELRSDLLPPFAADLLPRSVALHLKVEDLDLQTPAEIFVDHLDPELERLIPWKAGAAIIESFEDRPPRFLVEKSRVVGDGYDVTVDVEAERDRDGYGVVADVSATGIDGVIAKLQAAGSVEALQMVGMLSVAKGFGRDEGDGRMSWTVERSSDGAIAMNGTEIVPAPAR